MPAAADAIDQLFDSKRATSIVRLLKFRKFVYCVHMMYLMRSLDVLKIHSPRVHVHVPHVPLSRRLGTGIARSPLPPRILQGLDPVALVKEVVPCEVTTILEPQDRMPAREEELFPVAHDERS